MVGLGLGLFINEGVVRVKRRGEVGGMEKEGREGGGRGREGEEGGGRKGMGGRR